MLMRRPISLALRLTLLFAIAALIVFPLFGWFISQSAENHFEAGDGNELKTIAGAVEKAISTHRPGDDLISLKQRFDDILVGHHHATLYILDGDGQAVYASPGPDLSTLLALPPDSRAANGSLRLWSDAEHSYQTLIQTTQEIAEAVTKPHTLVVAVPIDQHLQYLTTFRQTLWLMIASGIAAMSLMGGFAVRQGHIPLHRIVRQIRRISANELDTTLSPMTMPRELASLAVSVNEMLERIKAAMHRLRDFNADIAHELRTPISNLMTQTQVVLSRPRSAEEYREILFSNLEEYERLAQMVGDMLFIAQTDNNSQKKNLCDLDLSAEVHTLFDYYGALAEQRGITLAVVGQAAVTGDRLMLQRALSNLLSNAIRHTPAGATVRILLSTEDNGETDIVVENPGLEIPPDHLPKLFDRFYRVDPSRHQNEASTGLGLAIVKSIVEAHGGKIDVASSSQITRFRITLPI